MPAERKGNLETYCPSLTPANHSQIRLPNIVNLNRREQQWGITERKQGWNVDNTGLIFEECFFSEKHISSRRVSLLSRLRSQRHLPSPFSCMELAGNWNSLFMEHVKILIFKSV